MIAANGPRDKCVLIAAYQMCLAEAGGTNEQENIVATRASNQNKCVDAKPLIDPRVVARNGGLAFEVDAGADIIMSRIRKDKIRCLRFVGAVFCFVQKA